MIRNAIKFVSCLIILSITGCANIASLLSTPTPVSTSQATATPQPLPSATPTSSSQNQARLLRIWLPPRFDPKGDSASAKMLAQRLTDFESAHPGLRIDVRIKAEDGTASLLNALTITHDAAPASLPDLIALPRHDLVIAATNGLLHPMDGLSTLLDDPSWYPFARELGHVQNIGYGLPFASNALVLIHRTDLEINSWDDILASKKLLLFPAGDTQSLFLLSLYKSAGGKLTDDQGKPTLQETPLTETLTLLQNGYEAKIFSSSILSYKTDDQAVQAYHAGQGSMLVTWATNTNESIQPLPALAAPHTFADGWIWALAGSSTENQQLAVELAEYLLSDDFSPQWIKSAGYLPVRLSEDPVDGSILESAQLMPNEDVLDVLGPIMNQMLIRLLEGEQVDVLVQSALDQIK